MNEIFDPEVLRNLSDDECRLLLRHLVDREQRSPKRPGSSWKWDLLLVAIILSCILLAAWIGYLGVSLPRYYRAGGWRGTWVGFDVAELVAFVATGWAAWRRRQMLIICLVVLATLLFCDAWFDVVLDARTPGFLGSLLSALLLELPLAVLAVVIARRLLKMTIGQIMMYEGMAGPVPPLWKIPLFGPGAGTPLHRLLRARAAHRSAAEVGTSGAGSTLPPADGPPSA